MKRINSYAGRSLSDTVGTAGSMLLFLIFSACMLIMIAAAASTYSRISAGFGQTFAGSASLRYVSNKIRAADSVSVIYGGRALVTEEDGVMCVIYSGSGGLYEKTLPSGAEPETSGGERVFASAEMTITEDGGLYDVTIVCGGKSADVLVRKG